MGRGEKKTEGEEENGGRGRKRRERKKTEGEEEGKRRRGESESARARESERARARARARAREQEGEREGGGEGRGVRRPGEGGVLYNFSALRRTQTIIMDELLANGIGVCWKHSSVNSEPSGHNLWIHTIHTHPRRGRVRCSYMCHGQRLSGCQREEDPRRRSAVSGGDASVLDRCA